MHPTQQALEFIREFLKLGSPSCASLRRKKNLPLICLFVKPLIYCFLAGFLFHPFFARLGYILQSGAGAVLCFLFDALLVTARLGRASLDKFSGLFANS
jgi:hypothetical protein